MADMMNKESFIVYKLCVIIHVLHLLSITWSALPAHELLGFSALSHP